MRDAQPKAIQLSDYRAPNYQVETTHLRFELFNDYTIVHSRLDLVRHQADATSLHLDGQELELISIELDGQPLTAERYVLGEESMEIHGLGERHTQWRFMAWVSVIPWPS